MQHAETIEAADPQSLVNAYFCKEAGYWADIYEHEGIKEAVHQERLRAAVAMAVGLRLLPARVLDVGCGAGVAAVELARRGFEVEAIDPLQVMIDATRARAEKAGVDARVTSRIGDIHAIPFRDQTFDLVIALGVLPWLPQVAEPLREISRVLRAGGYLIASVDTLWQLRQLPDPFSNPLMRVPRRLAACILRPSSRGVRSHVISLRAFRRILAAEGYREITGVAVGFGPFTIFKRELLPNSAGLKLNHWLQSLANRGVPIVRSTGSQYLVLANKHAVRASV